MDNNIPSGSSLSFQLIKNNSPKLDLPPIFHSKKDLLDSTITKIASTNIRTLNKNKFISLIDAMKDHNINIYGLSETNCSERQAKIWQHQLDVRTVGHKGRIIYLDLYFSDKRKLRLIQVYLNANQKERLQIKALHKYIDDTISDAQSRDIEVIIMGDFNINYRKYLMAFINNKWQFFLFRTLECKRLLDTIPIFNDNDEEMYTYTPADPNRQESRLDYIWASLPMLEKSVNSTVIENDHFDTDHKTVTLSLNTVQITGVFLNATNQKKKHIKRTVFQYDEMDKDDEYTWKNFNTHLDLKIENTLMKDFSSLNLVTLIPSGTCLGKPL
ncbi:hypothetical protein RclHR1_30040001 [Rhizophagus clarus]|uniref:Uncharacterized protein n=1 Tax=Rhizophagus clarus TaxID=94130 RepID=A0A2Z6R5B0_9GLOM|nr:hypothetical protein RclHR1_30040001 [Rhizophagus clarus]